MIHHVVIRYSTGGVMHLSGEPEHLAKALANHLDEGIFDTRQASLKVEVEIFHPGVCADIDESILA